MARAALRILNYSFRAERRDCRRDRVRLKSNDHDSVGSFERLARADYVPDERAAAHAMQNFGDAGIEARAFARGQDDDNRVFGGHELLIVASLIAFGNRERRRECFAARELQAHDVEAGIHVDNISSDAAREVAGEEYGGVANFCGFCVAAERGALRDYVENH